MQITQIETIRVGEFPDLIFVQIHTDGEVIGLGEKSKGKIKRGQAMLIAR